MKTTAALLCALLSTSAYAQFGNLLDKAKELQQKLEGQTAQQPAGQQANPGAPALPGMAPQMAAAPQGGASAKPFEFKGVYLGDSPEVVEQKLKPEAQECRTNPGKSAFGDSSLVCTGLEFGTFKKTVMTGYFVEGKLALLDVKHMAMEPNTVPLLSEKFGVSSGDIQKDKSDTTVVSTFCKSVEPKFVARQESLTIVDSKGGKIQGRDCGFLRYATIMVDENLIARRSAAVEEENKAAQADRARAAEEKKKDAITKF